MGALKRAALASVLICGGTAMLGLLAMDSMTGRQDFQMIAELPRELSQQGELSQKRAEDGTMLGRTCIGYRCLAHVRTDARTRSFGPEFDEDADLFLFRSDRRKSLMLVAGHQPLAIMDEASTAWEWRDPSLLETGYWLRVFPSLVFVGLLGWLMALSLAVARSQVGRRLAVIAGAEEGRVDGGWLRTSDASTPRRVEADDGDVLVIDTPHPNAPYRGDERDRSFELLDGDREDNAQPLERRARLLDRATITMATVTGVPLMAAFIAALVY